MSCLQGNIRFLDGYDPSAVSAKKNLISSLRTSMDSPGQLDEYYLGQAIAGTTGTIPEFIRRVEAVTAEDCAACARGITLDTVFFLKGIEA